MGSARNTKASDKQTIGKKLVTLLKKRYSTSVPGNDRSVMGTLLFSVCLENLTHEEAEAAWERVQERFLDWNEIRVSSISEVAEALDEVDDAEHRAMRIRGALQHVYDDSVVTGKQVDDPFDLDPLKRRTHEQAVKQLSKIRQLTPFTRQYLLHEALGSHVVPLDDRSYRVVVWLGFVEPGTDLDAASDSLKAVVRKSDAPLFVHLLRQLATDPKLLPEFDEVNVETEDEEDPYDPTTAVERLEELFKGRRKKAKTTRKSTPKSAAKKTRKKTTAKKSSTSKTTKKKATKRKTTSRR